MIAQWYCLDCHRWRELGPHGNCQVCDSAAMCVAEREATFDATRTESFSNLYALTLYVYYLILSGGIYRPDTRETK